MSKRNKTAQIKAPVVGETLPENPAAAATLVSAGAPEPAAFDGPELAAPDGDTLVAAAGPPAGSGTTSAAPKGHPFSDYTSDECVVAFRGYTLDTQRWAINAIEERAIREQEEADRRERAAALKKIADDATAELKRLFGGKGSAHRAAGGESKGGNGKGSAGGTRYNGFHEATGLTCGQFSGWAGLAGWKPAEAHKVLVAFGAADYVPYRTYMARARNGEYNVPEVSDDQVARLEAARDAQ
jgi:hypothetical protein